MNLFEYAKDIARAYADGLQEGAKRESEAKEGASAPDQGPSVTGTTARCADLTGGTAEILSPAEAAAIVARASEADALDIEALYQSHEALRARLTGVLEYDRLLADHAQAVKCEHEELLNERCVEETIRYHMQQAAPVAAGVSQ